MAIISRSVIGLVVLAMLSIFASSIDGACDVTALASCLGQLDANIACSELRTTCGDQNGDGNYEELGCTQANLPPLTAYLEGVNAAISNVCGEKYSGAYDIDCSASSTIEGNANSCVTGLSNKALKSGVATGPDFDVTKLTEDQATKLCTVITAKDVLFTQTCVNYIASACTAVHLSDLQRNLQSAADECGYDTSKSSKETGLGIATLLGALLLIHVLQASLVS